MEYNSQTIKKPMTEYFNVRELRCWITGGKPKHKERQPDTRQRKRHNTWTHHV